MMKTLTVILITMAGGILLTCSSDKDAPSADGRQKNRISAAQERMAGVRTGEIQRKLLSRTIGCTGEVEVRPQGVASVSAPLGGFVGRLNLVPGAFVKKGTVLTTIHNPEYIALQQSWLETRGQLTFARQEFERQKLLREENATAEKRLQETESSYNMLLARLMGVEEQLKLIGVDLEVLRQGTIQSAVALKAPIQGYITRVNRHQGEFAAPSDELFEIVDTNDLHLHLNAFEKDVAQITRGQTIRFRAIGSERAYSGKVLFVSPRRSDDNRTYSVHAAIDKPDAFLKPGLYVDAEIQLSNDSVYALPAEAVVKDGEATVAIIADDGQYLVTPVETGVKKDGWIEIRDASRLVNKRVVVTGAWRLLPALKESEGGG